MKKIVILGNGFDLAHKLPTSYSDFIKNMINESINYNTKVRRDLIDVGPLPSEDQSYEYIKDNFIRLSTDNLNSPVVSKPIRVKNKFLFGMLKSFFSADWVNIEEYYFEILSTTSEDKIDLLNQNFETIKKYLSNYLTEKADFSSFIKVNKYKRIFLDEDPKQVIFVNFNYTDTIKQYFQDLQIPKILINIHGKLNFSDNPVVFGYGDDENQKYQEVKGKNDNRYTKNLKRQLYNLAPEYEKLNQFLSTNTDDINVYVLGHSLGLTDKTLLKEIFENDNVKRIKMFYHNDRESYRNLNDNLSRIVSNDTLNNKVINFPSSERIPQIS